MSAASLESSYAEKRTTAEKAIRLIRSGQRVFIGSSCGEPQHLVATLLSHKRDYADLEILRLLSLEGAITATAGDQTLGRTFSVRSLYQGAGETANLVGGRRFLTPMNLSLIPGLLRSGQLPIHVALVQVSRPDAFGWMSLGLSVDVTKAAVAAADHVIAQVNPRLPRVLGDSFIHIRDVDTFVEWEEDPLTSLDFARDEPNPAMATLIANLVEDGSTLQIGLGEGEASVWQALATKKDLGVTTVCMTEGLMALMQSGVINNRRKTYHPGKTIASLAMGNEVLYRFLHDNPAIEFHPADVVCHSATIAAEDRMVAINMATAIDLTGQIAADALPQNHFAGLMGINEFMQAANQSRFGKSIILLPALDGNGNSRILPELPSGSVVVPRGDVHHVITEYGAANLFGKNLRERALALIGIAHPDLRQTLMDEAKRLGLIEPERDLKQALLGVYPAHLEEMRSIEDVKILFRPIKSGDLRRVQEHYYAMDAQDTLSRFFMARKAFYKDQVGTLCDINYRTSMTFLAVVGEPGFERVIGIGEYAVEGAHEMAEVAFSVASDWQGKGIGVSLLRKLVAAARENGLAGLVAYTSTRNRAMLETMKKLPYQIRTTIEDDLLVLSARFDDPA